MKPYRDCYVIQSIQIIVWNCISFKISVNICKKLLCCNYCSGVIRGVRPSEIRLKPELSHPCVLYLNFPCDTSGLLFFRFSTRIRRGSTSIKLQYRFTFLTFYSLFLNSSLIMMDSYKSKKKFTFKVNNILILNFLILLWYFCRQWSNLVDMLGSG